MRIACLSLNHRLVPLETRERFVLDHEGSVEFLRGLKSKNDVIEALLLSTCNRLELFVVAENAGTAEAAAHAALAELSRIRDVQIDQLPTDRLVLEQTPAIRHLMRVAAGMESQILGESQVLGQVRACHRLSEEAGTSGKVIRRFWEKSLRAGKRVRSETALGEGALSVSYASLQLARKVFGGLTGRKVVVIGAGEIAQLVLQNLQGISLGRLSIINRTPERAEQIAEAHGGSVSALVDLGDVLVEADIVITCTASMEPVITREMLVASIGRRGRGMPLLIIDIGLPRDVEPTCASVEDVFLKNLDDLARLVKTNLREREREIPAAEVIIEQETLGFIDWLDGLRVEPMIRELRRIFEDACKDELEKLKPGLDEESYEMVEKIARRLVKRLLHQPSENLRRHEGVRDPEVIALIQDVFKNVRVSGSDTDASEVVD